MDDDDPRAMEQWTRKIEQIGRDALQAQGDINKAAVDNKSLLADLEKLRAAAKDVVTSRSVAYFDSDQLSHIYVSVDGALLVKVREALDALEEKP